MRTNDEAAIEQQIQDKGLNAPRLTPAHIDAQIMAEQFHVFEGTALTVCALTLRNGFQVIGMSAAASPENFDAEIGRTIARKNAREQIWQLEGYLLRERLAGRTTGGGDTGNMIVTYDGKGFVVTREEMEDSLGPHALIAGYRGLVSSVSDREIEADNWAKRAIQRPPETFEHRGLNQETLSRRGQAICLWAGVTGLHVRAAQHLAAIHAAMDCVSEA